LSDPARGPRLGLSSHITFGVKLCFGAHNFSSQKKLFLVALSSSYNSYLSYRQLASKTESCDNIRTWRNDQPVTVELHVLLIWEYQNVFNK